MALILFAKPSSSGQTKISRRRFIYIYSRFFYRQVGGGRPNGRRLVGLDQKIYKVLQISCKTHKNIYHLNVLKSIITCRDSIWFFDISYSSVFYFHAARVLLCVINWRHCIDIFTMVVNLRTNMIFGRKVDYRYWLF